MCGNKNKTPIFLPINRNEYIPFRCTYDLIEIPYSTDFI